MNEEDMTFENEEETKKKSSKKGLLIGLIVIVAIVIAVIAYIMFKEPESQKVIGKYKINFDNPVVIYIDEPLDIPVKLETKEKDTEEVKTTLTTEDDIISIKDGEFYGKSGSILIEPLSPGEASVDIVSSIGADKYSQVLTTKTMNVVVCPRFDDKLLQKKEIIVEKGSTRNISLNFSNNECYKYVTFTSENPYVLTATDEGEITGLNEGITTVSIYNGTETIQLIVNVV